MFNWRSLVMATLAAGALTYGVADASAGAPCVGHCYEKVATPPVYGSVAEQVMVAPPRHVAHVVPGEYAVVQRAVTVRPEHTVARHIPAEYSSVDETVMVSPGGKRWTVTIDAYGRKIGCWVVDPPQYATRSRSVMVRPGGVVYERVPAVTAVATQRVMTRQPTVVRETIPGVYATRHRTVMVHPGHAYWRSLGRGY